MGKNSNILMITAAVILYLASTGISFAVFKSRQAGKVAVQPSASADQKSKFNIDPAVPRTEACPINGAMFTKQEKDVWEKRRPLAVMIENHAESRPQSGLSYADVVYETVAEGGITRFMGVFYCGISAYNIGFAPVRSARTYFVDWVSEYDALYNHVGGAGKCNDDTVDTRAKALCQIQKYGIKDMDQFSIPFPTCYRNYDRLDHEVATEHTMVCYSDKLYDLAAKRDWTNVDEEGVAWDKNFTPWKFKDETQAADRGTVAGISFTHWPNTSYANDYSVEWKYDSQTNSYLRFNGGKEHTDLETQKQISAKSVVIQYAKETANIDEHMHVLYGTIGSGKAIIFQDGKAVIGTWKKAARTERTKFFDDKGKEIAFNRGQIWIEVVATDTQITY